MISDTGRLDNPNTGEANSAGASVEQNDETVNGEFVASGAVTARQDAATQQARAEKFPAGRVL
jgi:hypothetical protein